MKMPEFTQSGDATTSAVSNENWLAAVAKRLGLCDSSITIHMPGGQLAIEVNDQMHVRMTGPVVHVANGHLSLEMLNADEAVHPGEAP